MSNAFKNSEMTDDEIRLGILRLIRSAKVDDVSLGATPRMLLELGADIKSIEDALTWLGGQDFICVQKRHFLITSKGLDFLSAGDEPPGDLGRASGQALPDSGQAGAAAALPACDPSQEGS